jgi:hypothetical protein
VAVSSIDRLLLVGLYRLAPGVLEALKIIRPETLLRWHRAGFRAHWRWKFRPHGGRPQTAAEIRRLIREISIANPLWGAPRIHGELLKLGIDVGAEDNDTDYIFGLAGNAALDAVVAEAADNLRFHLAMSSRAKAAPLLEGDASIELDVGAANHLGPFGCFLAHVVSHLLGRTL